MAYPKLTDKPGAIETAQAIGSGRMSAVEAVDAAITRIEHLDADLNALAVPDFERACAAAKALDKAGPRDDQPLFGVPMTIKESFDVEGLPTTWGHESVADKLAPRDAELVRRLKAAGAVILGKTNVPVNLADWQSVNPVYGRTNNPHDTARSPGGSSGGAAAAVASGMVPCEFGTDIGGSVRVPAHFCGIWGHKISWGLIPLAGHDHPIASRADGFVAAHESPLGIPGPLARNAEDLAVLTLIGARYTLDHSDKPLSQCRVLAITQYPGSPVAAEVSEPLEMAIEAMMTAGIDVDRTSPLVPDLERQYADYLRMLNVVMSRGAPAPNGKSASASDWFDMLDAQAANAAQWAQLFEHYDFVLAPPAPILANPHQEQRLFDGKIEMNGEVVSGASGLAWAGIATYPHLPSTVLPIGSSEVDGVDLPCGMQVMGPAMSDLDCIHAAGEIAKILHG